MSDYGHEKIYWEHNKMILKYKIKIYVDLLIVEKKNELDLLIEKFKIRKFIEACNHFHP